MTESGFSPREASNFVPRTLEARVEQFKDQERLEAERDKAQKALVSCVEASYGAEAAHQANKVLYIDRAFRETAETPDELQVVDIYTGPAERQSPFSQLALRHPLLLTEPDDGAFMNLDHGLEYYDQTMDIDRAALRGAQQAWADAHRTRFQTNPNEFLSLMQEALKADVTEEDLRLMRQYMGTEDFPDQIANAIGGHVLDPDGVLYTPVNLLVNAMGGGVNVQEIARSSPNDALSPRHSLRFLEAAGIRKTSSIPDRRLPHLSFPVSGVPGVRAWLSPSPAPETGYYRVFGLGIGPQMAAYLGTAARLNYRDASVFNSANRDLARLRLENATR
jgi:hypothetical protein